MTDKPRIVKVVTPKSLAAREEAVKRNENRVKKKIRDLLKFSQVPALQLSQRGGFQQRRKLRDGRIREMANTLGMESSELNATKRLFDIKHPAIKLVNTAIADMTSFFMNGTLPYVIQRGVRLFKFVEPKPEAIQALLKIPREKPLSEDGARQVLILDQLVLFKEQLNEKIEIAKEAVAKFNRESFHEVLAERRQKLGSEFDPDDYGSGIRLVVTLRDVSIAPPTHLCQSHPELRNQALQQMKKDYEAATNALIDATITSFQDSLVHLHERLTGADSEGNRKKFQDSTVLVFGDAIQEFQNSIKALGATNPQLDECVARVADMVNGVRPGALRDNDRIRAKVAEQTKEIFESLNKALVDRPVRSINRELLKLQSKGATGE